MTPAARLARACELIDQAVGEIEAAADGVPAYALDSMRFLKAELRVSTRRIENAAKVLGGGPKPAA